ncbi:7-cyano-7-deazaguanine synthase QueC [Pelotomaculum terephthalicicum JT]|uniref:7-cyano-7-deazaguanine synthase QueC n=1 Tax=Pelotomaculum terephthalicicum TaxID=206393 RepID=UPI0009C43E9E|nr:7-cyano-7-deazaguanine synthase QueC [Pelotomaculum terephthalicicum]MCG9967637.1 7-cyano-7-deazaguanine synthase QueC [Pelotomaculum terephthalicicum JT]OPY60854.1 MAG: 7-cyano-7-deazaguanine synthase [Pelotomaculum sp. PtaU1.Bin065]
MKGIVLLSGGLDSAVSLACALRESDIVLCLTFDYGQRASQNEIKAAASLAGHYRLRHQVVEVPFLRDITGTALVKSDLELPEPEITALDEKTAAGASAAQVWVPNRNGLFINIAAAFAESNDAQLVVTGFNSEEAATFPDNSAGFVRAINDSLYYSTLNHVGVVSYTQRLDKADILKLGIKMSVPFQHIWSCYRGGEKMCGRCESCLRLKRAADLAAFDLSGMSILRGI